MSPDPTTAISLTTVFLLSLAGSVHCAGMCGGFVALFGGRTNGSMGSHGAYHVGRLLTYSTLGAVAGSLGVGPNLSGSMLGIQRTAALLTALLFLVWGVRILADRHWEPSIAGHGDLVPGPAGRKNGALQRWVFTLFRKVLGGGVSPTRQAFSLGLLSGALPCGWLWGFLLLAAGSGSITIGAAVMASFWAGTVPILLGVGVISRSVTCLSFLRGKLATGLVLVLAGLFSLFVHTKPLVARPPGGPAAYQGTAPGGEHSCH